MVADPSLLDVHATKQLIPNNMRKENQGMKIEGKETRKPNQEIRNQGN